MRKKIEEILKVYYVAPHAVPDGTKWDFPRCSDCFCTIQQVHTHSYNKDLVEPLAELITWEQKKQFQWGVNYLATLINNSTLISELYGWKSILDMCVDQARKIGEVKETDYKI